MSTEMHTVNFQWNTYIATLCIHVCIHVGILNKNLLRKLKIKYSSKYKNEQTLKVEFELKTCPFFSSLINFVSQFNKI